MKNHVKIIFHIDLNAFFASCAMIKEPYLKDKAFVVGGGVLRSGIITTASYPARKYGIKSAMSIAEALNRYPKLLVVPTDFKLYQKYSRLFFSFLKKYSSIILEGSIDEAYVDMTEACEKKHPLDLAKEIQEGLLKAHQLPCSIGIAPTLFLAKMASDIKKPLGVTVLRKKDIVKILFPLPISDIHGIGKKTYPKLEALGIKTIGDFTKESFKPMVLKVLSEQNYESVMAHLLGRSSDIIDPKQYSIPKSVSQETTLNYPIDHAQTLFEHLKQMLDTAYEKLVNDELVSKTIGIKLRNAQFETISRSFSFSDYDMRYEPFLEAIEHLFDQHYKGEPLRLVGVFFNQVILKKDLKIDINLFNYHRFTKRDAQIFDHIKKDKND